MSNPRHVVEIEISPAGRRELSVRIDGQEIRDIVALDLAVEATQEVAQLAITLAPARVDVRGFADVAIARAGTVDPARD